MRIILLSSLLLIIAINVSASKWEECQIIRTAPVFINESDVPTSHIDWRSVNKLVEEGKARLLDPGTPVKVRKEDGYQTVYTIDHYDRYYYIRKDALSCHGVPDTPSISTDITQDPKSLINTEQTLYLLAAKTKDAIPSILLLVVAVFVIVLIILWIIVPFILLGTNKRLDTLSKQLDTIIQLTEHHNERR